MKLIDAYNLLVEDGIADNHRYFAEVYKIYGFADDAPLRDYLDFIEHEPTHWLRGFPAKLNVKIAFAKPKTAVIKLLKKQSVVEALGADYVARIYDCIWNTFKKEADAILKERAVATSVAATVAVQLERAEQQEIQEYEVMSVGSVDTLEQPTPPLRSYKTLSLFGKADEETTAMASVADDRVEFLKSVLFKLSATLPEGVADAFQMLVSRV